MTEWITTAEAAGAADGKPGAVAKAGKGIGKLGSGVVEILGGKKWRNEMWIDEGKRLEETNCIKVQVQL